MKAIVDGKIFPRTVKEPLSQEETTGEVTFRREGLLRMHGGKPA